MFLPPNMIRTLLCHEISSFLQFLCDDTGPKSSFLFPVLLGMVCFCLSVEWYVSVCLWNGKCLSVCKMVCIVSVWYVLCLSVCAIVCIVSVCLWIGMYYVCLWGNVGLHQADIFMHTPRSLDTMQKPCGRALLSGSAPKNHHQGTTRSTWRRLQTYTASKMIYYIELFS